MEIVISDNISDNQLGVHRPSEELAGRYYNDTGLCNRLLFWEVIQIINRLHNNRFDVVVYDNQWPEKNIITLQNTIFKSHIDISHHLPITDDMLIEILNNNLTLVDGNYYTNFKYLQIADVHILDENGEDYFFDRIIPTIQFKDDSINKLLKNKVSDMIGIHVRRGRGVKFNSNILNSLPESIRDDYYKHKLEDKACWDLYIYDYIEDSIYFSYIDAILKINPTQQFFISFDMEDKYFEHWYKRYPNNIISKKEFYQLIDANKYLGTEVYSFDKPFVRKEGILHFYNFLDLYCLSNTKILIKLFMSSWSDFANDYLGQSRVSVIANQITPKKLVKLYKSHFL